MLTTRLAKWSISAQMLFALLAAFGTYFCMYAFRKPFTVGQYQEAAAIWGGVDFKIAIVIAQVLGYATSKFIGIKVISELHPANRYRLLLLLIGAAALALFGFALAKDSPWSLLFLFLNGLPLGMIWGIVFSYLEGRQQTEFLGAGLCASFILSSGAVKSVGAWMMQDYGVAVYWMPLYTALLFFPLLALFGWLLTRVPPPTTEDQRLRTPRQPMSRQQRWAFFQSLAPGLIALMSCYVAITAYRDFRDNFAAELWEALGYGDVPVVFTLAELPTAILVLIMLALTVFIRNNARALILYHWIILSGCVLIGGTTFAYATGWLAGDWWMVLVGAGLYVVYVPFNAILFDRLIATFRQVATAGFLIYVADAWGYVGSVTTLLYKNFGTADLSWLAFFKTLSYGVSILAGITTLIALLYFRARLRTPQLNSV